MDWKSEYDLLRGHLHEFPQKHALAEMALAGIESGVRELAKYGLMFEVRNVTPGYDPTPMAKPDIMSNPMAQSIRQVPAAVPVRVTESNELAPEDEPEAAPAPAAPAPFPKMLYHPKGLTYKDAEGQAHPVTRVVSDDRALADALKAGWTEEPGGSEVEAGEAEPGEAAPAEPS